MRKSLILIAVLFVVLFIHSCTGTGEILITFEENGGTEVEDVRVSTASASINLPESTKEGFTFDGWYLDEDLTQSFTIAALLTHTSLTLYAKWAINQYAISFDSDGGNVIDPITQDYDTTVLEPAEPTKEGHTFVGWFSDEALSVPYVFTTMPAEDITLYGKWIVNVDDYSINFWSNGGSIVDSLIYPEGTNITAPTEPIKEGYTFEGWYSDETLYTLYTFTIMPSQNITLYAKWIPINYQVTYVFNADYQTIYPHSWPETYTVEGDYPIVIPWIDLGIFRGWYDNESLAGERITHLNDYIGDITLYAKWEYRDLSTIEHLHEYTQNIESHAMFFNAKIQGIIYYANSEHGTYWIYDGNRHLEIRTSNFILELGEEYEIVGRYYIYSYPWVTSQDPPYYPRMKEIVSVENLNHQLGLAIPEVINMTFSMLGEIPSNDYAYFGQPIKISAIIDRSDIAGIHAYAPDYLGPMLLITHLNAHISFILQYRRYQTIELYYILAGNLNVENGPNRWYAAHYESMCITRTVIFNHDGTGIQSAIGDIGDLIDYEEPYKEGYTFAGWYLDEALTQHYGNEITHIPENHLVLYAKWINNLDLLYNFTLLSNQTYEITLHCPINCSKTE